MYNAATPRRRIYSQENREKEKDAAKCVFARCKRNVKWKERTNEVEVKESLSTKKAQAPTIYTHLFKPVSPLLFTSSFRSSEIFVFTSFLHHIFIYYDFGLIQFLEFGTIYYLLG